MKKNDLKKLALLGITGALLAGQGTAESAQRNIDTNQLIARNGCGGKSGCGGHHRPAQAPVQYQSMQEREGASTQYNEYIGRDVAIERQQGRQITEQQLLGLLDPQTRRIYNNLDQDGRDLALDLVNRGNYQDPNRAVRVAADQIQNGMMQNGTMQQRGMMQRDGMMQGHQGRMSPR